jgi:hypothetical protein
VHVVAPAAAEKNPAVHLAHAVSPSAVPAYVAAQSGHASLADRYFPIGHTVHAVCPPASATVLPTHPAHAELPSAPATLPALHSAQADAPFDAWYLPVPQRVHAVSPVDAV